MNNVFLQVTKAVKCQSKTYVTEGVLAKYLGQKKAYCDSKCHRNIICCAPQAPETFDPQLLLFNSKNKAGTALKWTDSKDLGKQGGSKGKVIFVIHGFMSTYKTVDWMNQIKDGWLKRDAECNVILVDWGKGNQLNYFQAIANVRTVGALMGHAITIWGVSTLLFATSRSLRSHSAEARPTSSFIPFSFPFP